MKESATRSHASRASFFAFLMLFFQSTSLPAQVSQRQQEDAWAKAIRLAESLIGDGGVFDARGAESKVDALVDLHAQFCRDVLGKPVPSQRVLLVKQGFRIFLGSATDRYGGEKRLATLRLVRDLAANRAVFVELLSADSSVEAVEQQLLGYLERNQSLSYKEPVPVGRQLKIPNSNTPLRIVSDAIRLVGDQGTSGHYNRAIDAGEIITLNIPLKNFANHPFRSTSAILKTTDAYVRANVSKAVYTERSVVSGETVTFAPGASITAKQNFSFTVSPKCPDNHEVVFSLHVGDSDYGEFSIPFSVVVYHVGPLDFGVVKIDDDRFGDSDGNKNGVMEPGESIEYVLPLRNAGVVEIADITATLFCSEPKIHFKAGYDVNRYKVVPPQAERPIPASFVFTLEGNDQEFPKPVYLRMLTKATAREVSYSWLRTQSHPVGVSDIFWDKGTAAARKWLDDPNSTLSSGTRLAKEILGSIDTDRLQYRQDDKSSWPLFSKILIKMLRLKMKEGGYDDAKRMAETFLNPDPNDLAEQEKASAIFTELPQFKVALQAIAKEAKALAEAKVKLEKEAK